MEMAFLQNSPRDYCKYQVNITPSNPESILGRAGFGKGTVGGLVTLDMKEVSLLLLAFVPEPGPGGLRKT